MTTEFHSARKISQSPFRTHIHAHKPAASNSGYTHVPSVWHSSPAPFAILLGGQAGHGDSQRLEEALVTGSANFAEPSAGCDQAQLLILSAEWSPGGSHTALAMAMHV